MNMFGLQSTPPPAPPERSKLAQAAPAIGTAIGTVAGAVIGSIIPGAGTIVGGLLGATIGGAIGGGIGSLFKMGDDAAKTSQWNDQMGQYSQVRQQELQQYMQMMMMQAGGGIQMQTGMMGQMGMPTGMPMGMPGASGYPVPGFGGGAPNFIR